MRALDRYPRQICIDYIVGRSLSEDPSSMALIVNGRSSAFIRKMMKMRRALRVKPVRNTPGREVKKGDLRRVTDGQFFHGVLRLRSNGRKADDAISLVRVGVGEVRRNVLLPHSRGLDYVVVPTSPLGASIEAEDFRAERLDLATSLWLRLRLALLFKKKKYLRFDGFSVFSVGPKPERKRFTDVQPAHGQHRSLARRRRDQRASRAHPRMGVGGAGRAASLAMRARTPPRSSPTSTTRKPGAKSPGRLRA